jgi:hypothetical protein
MYASLARFGYGLVKSIKPDKVKKFLQPGLEKIANPQLKQRSYLKREQRLIKVYEG